VIGQSRMSVESKASESSRGFLPCAVIEFSVSEVEGEGECDWRILLCDGNVTNEGGLGSEEPNPNVESENV